MAQIIGQIESLKKIRRELNQNGITKINSIGEINDFLANYEAEVWEIYQHAKLKLNNEVDNLQSELTCLSS